MTPDRARGSPTPAVPVSAMAIPADGSDQAPRIRRLVGVYDADATLRGELAYWIGARLGRSHCALCEITHGLARERNAWKTCRAGLPVPFDTYHRDDQPDAISVATSNVAPVIVADTDRGFVPLLSPADLDACGGSAEKLIEAIELAVGHNALLWPSP